MGWPTGWGQGVLLPCFLLIFIPNPIPKKEQKSPGTVAFSLVYTPDA